MNDLNIFDKDDFNKFWISLNEKDPVNFPIELDENNSSLFFDIFNLYLKKIDYAEKNE